MNVTILPILTDNYCYILESGGVIGIVDPGEAEPVIKYLEEKNLTPDVIFNTHHHGDHIAGNAQIMEKYTCGLVGPAAETQRIHNMTQTFSEGGALSFGDETFQVLETPGHTSGHICFFAPESKTLFCGDTLFSLGCGRLFEGTAEQMWNSLQKLMTLPEETKIYCGHEYTQVNGEFCLANDPENPELITRMEEVRVLRSEGKPTLPVTLDVEKKTNIFLRAQDVQDFARLRKLKDSA